MRSPSSRVLANRVDIYPAVAGQDANGAPQFTYAGSPASQVACTMQAGDVEEVVEEDAGGQQRITRLLHYRIMFGSPTGVKPRDKIIYTDLAGIVHTLFAHVERDEAGRGAAFTVFAIERI
jgi:hypothetical protein